MPFEDHPQSLRDIRESIGNIVVFLGDISFDGYLRDRKTQASVERELQIISEAAVRLGKDVDSICPGPDWRNIRGLGNALRHAYNDINHAIIWATVHKDLPPLRTAVEAGLVRLGQGRGSSLK